MDEAKSVTSLDSWSAISEKTVFILDRSPYFTQVSSGHKIEGDFVKDSKKTALLYDNQPIIQQFDRSLWTCTVEAVVGYSRLVWDLFTPDQRCISILSIDPKSAATSSSGKPNVIEKICAWRDEDQNLDQLLKSLAKNSHCHQVSPPNGLIATNDIAKIPNCASDSPFVISSLEQALDELSELTSSQVAIKANASLSDPKSTNLPLEDNNGRIILISSFQNDQAISDIVATFESLLKKKNAVTTSELLNNQQNKSAATKSSIQHSPINYCDLVIVNTFPISDEGPCSRIAGLTAFKPNLHVRAYSVKSGRIIAGLLNNLCLQHHNLKSTTITGIPMKEEQSASSSSQYDVEIVHCSSIHEDILNSGSPLLEGVVEVIDRNGFPCDTFKLGWCTPRTTTVELNHCVAVSRITAVDVNSRPSACLTNFLLNGRQVMLEISKSKSNRMTTHILASHGGELYIHSLATSQHKLNLNDPPSISDHLGGKVTDYRIEDFTTLMNNNILIRTHLDDSLSRTCNLIKRQTLYWPIDLGHSLLFSVNILFNLPKIVPEETLTPNQIEECKRAIDNLSKAERDGQALPTLPIVDIIKQHSGAKTSITKQEHLYRFLWNELEFFLKVHSTTPEHSLILDYMHERHSERKSVDSTERGSKRAANKALSTIESPTKRHETNSQLLPELDESPQSSVLIQQNGPFFKSGLNLHQTYLQLFNRHHRVRSKLPFVGRTPQPAQPVVAQQSEPQAAATTAPVVTPRNSHMTTNAI